LGVLSSRCARAWFVWLALAAGLAAGSPAHAADFEEVDRIVAVVGARSPGPDVRLVLASDVAFRARLALLAEGDEDALSRALPESLRAAVLSQVLGEMMLAAESDRLSMAAPGPAERAQERGRLAAMVGGGARLEQAMRTLGVDPDELEAVVTLRATVAAFLDANLERIAVTDDEVTAAARDAEAEGARPELAQVRAALQQERVEAAVASWVNTLAQRVPHRVID
jgi:hypothetical protein